MAGKSGSALLGFLRSRKEVDVNDETKTRDGNKTQQNVNANATEERRKSKTTIEFSRKSLQVRNDNAIVS